MLEDVRRQSRDVHLIYVSRLVNVLGNGMVFPFATLHFHVNLGIPLSVVGFGLLLNNVGTALGSAVGGRFADRYGKKNVMVASMASSAFTLSAYAFVTTGPGFVSVAALAGVTAGLYAPASQGLLADLTSSEQRDRSYAVLKVASNAGFGLGFVAGGLLYSVASESIFVVDGVTSAVVAATLYLYLKPSETLETREDSANLRTVLRVLGQKKVVLIAALNVVFAVAYGQMGATVPVFAKETLGLTSSEIGVIYVLNPLVLVALQLPVVSAVENWRRTRGLMLSSLFWAMSFLSVYLGYRVSFLFAVVFLGGFLVLRTLGEILHAPLMTSLMSDVAVEDLRSSFLSILEITKRLGIGLGSMMGGVFFDYGADQLLWITLIGAMAFLGLGLYVLENWVSRNENRP